MFQLDHRKHCLGYVKTEIALSYIPQMISPTIQNCHEDLKTQSSMYTKKKSLSDFQNMLLSHSVWAVSLNFFFKHGKTHTKNVKCLVISSRVVPYCFNFWSFQGVLMGDRALSRR